MISHDVVFAALIPESHRGISVHVAPQGSLGCSLSPPCLMASSKAAKLLSVFEWTDIPRTPKISRGLQHMGSSRNRRNADLRGADVGFHCAVSTFFLLTFDLLGARMMHQL